MACETKSAEEQNGVGKASSFRNTVFRKHIETDLSHRSK
jgi:hypothetical protein